MAFDPKDLLDVSYLLTFTGGAAIGAAGQYFADRFTDQRRRQEQKSEEASAFTALKRDMPALFAEMAQDLADDDSNSVREFVIVPNKRVMFNGTKPRFMYYEEEHNHLQTQVDRLESAGYVQDVRTGKAPIYRMSEQFVQLLRANA